MPTPYRKINGWETARGSVRQGAFSFSTEKYSTAVFMIVSCFRSMRSDSNRRLSYNVRKSCTVCATFFVPRDRCKPHTRGTRIASLLRMRSQIRQIKVICARGTWIASFYERAQYTLYLQLSAHVVHGLRRQNRTVFQAILFCF